MSDKMTLNQRRALECVQQAREQGMTLSAYARKRGFSDRQIYDAIAALRRKGALPAPGSTRTSAKNDFVAVRIAPLPNSAAPPSSVVCQVRVGGTVIACQQWPPAAWLSTLGQVSRDAATPEH
jgi:predicted phage tail protein